MKKQRGAIKAENDAQIQSFRDALGIKTEGGKVDDKAIRYDDLHPSDPRRAVVEFTKVVAQATGRNFVFFRSTAKEQAKGKENGRYEPETNTIYIDINAGINELEKVLTDQVLPTVSHELVHIFAVEDPAGFAALSELVFEGLTKAEGKTRSFLISKEIQRINEADENSDEKRLAGKSEETIRAIAEEEIVARACEDRLANSRLMKEFIEEMERKESGLAQKFSNILGEAIKRLKEIFRQIASKLSRSHEAIQLRNLTTELEAIQSQYDALLERRTTEATGAPAEPAPSSEQQKNTSERGVMNANRKEALTWDIPWDSDNESTLAEQLEKHKDEINVMRPVAKIDYNKSNGDYLEALDKILEKWGYKISREKYGDFIFDDVVIKDIRRYVRSDADAAALISSPYVLKRGKIISGHKNHKNNGTTTITIAAPVILNNERGNVAVTVMFGKGRVHSFRVTTPDNETFELIKIEAETKSTGRIENNTIEPYTESASGSIITNPDESVNPQNSEDAKGEMKADRATYMTAREILMQFAMFDFKPSYQSRRSRV